MNSALVESIVAACVRVLPPYRPLALHEPDFTEAEQRYLRDCLGSGWVSTAGPFVGRFESELARLTGSRYVVATVNGTSALHAALLAAGVQQQDEVLVPALTFVATANAVAYCSAVPHFVESSVSTLGVDPAALAEYLSTHAVRDGSTALNRITGRPLRALIVMHTFGHPADLDSIQAIAESWGIALVEDAAEAVGSLYKGRHTGTFGKAGVLSFNGNKTVTTGGGGAVLTNDPEVAFKARHLCTTARVEAGWSFIHDQVGFNYRMPSLNAALGLGQIERLPKLLQAKQLLASRYAEAFSGLAGARFFVPRAEVRSNHWLNTLVLDAEHSEARDEVLARLNEGGIGARPPWAPMHTLPMYAHCPRMPLSVTEQLAARIVNLPSSPRLALSV